MSFQFHVTIEPSATGIVIILRSVDGSRVIAEFRLPWTVLTLLRKEQ